MPVGGVKYIQKTLIYVIGRLFLYALPFPQEEKISPVIPIHTNISSLLLTGSQRLP